MVVQPKAIHSPSDIPLQLTWFAFLQADFYEWSEAASLQYMW